MDKTMLQHHMDKSKEMLFDMLDEIYEIPVETWDDCETDMMKDIWEAIHHMCEVKKIQ